MAKIKAKDISPDERAAIVLAYLGGTPAAELVRRHQISEATLNKWRDKFIQGGQAALLNGRRSNEASAAEQENQQLKEALADAMLRIQVLKKLSLR